MEPDAQLVEAHRASLQNNARKGLAIPQYGNSAVPVWAHTAVCAHR